LNIEVLPIQLTEVDMALEKLGSERLPFLLMRKVNRIRREVRDYLEPWREDVAPLIKMYGEGGSIGPTSPRWAEFLESVLTNYADNVKIAIEPITEKDMEPLASRDDFSFPETLYEYLRSLGIIQE
jgi:hypothetical protein